MQCPSCGLQIDQQNLDRCPRCGYALTPTTGSYGQGGTQAPGYGNPPQSGEPGATGGYAPPQPPANPYGSYGNYGSYGGSGDAAPPSGYGPSSQQGPSAPYGPYGQGQYGQPAPPSGYGQPAPSSGYGQPYGQPAPSGYPIAPGYPPPGYPQAPYGPPPQRKSHTGLIVGIVALVVVALAACTGGTLFAIHSLGQATPIGALPTVTTASRTPTPLPSPTAARTLIYQNTFASGADGWSNDAGNCFWKSDGYHAANGYECYAPTGVQTSVDISVQAQQLSGDLNAPFGLVFGLDAQGNDYQYMIVSNSAWVLFRCAPASCKPAINYTDNAVIRGGLHTANTLEALVQGTHFDFFVNGTKVGSYDDPNYLSGRVGVAAGTSIESVFTNLVISRPT